jgi:glycine dehydrogenase subunit 1
MACRVTGRHRLAIADSVNPRHVRVVRTYTEPQGIVVDTVSAGAPALTAEHACLVVQSPDYFGRIGLVDDGPARLCKEAGALLVVSAEAMSLALFRPPGEFGADIVVADGQSLGLSMSFGGPYVGLFAAKQQHIRQMPGRIVGQTADVDGRRAYVLTLQAREQHIRRERASSNICTSEQLLALAVTVYLSCLGPRGLQQVARLCYEKSHYAAKLIGNMRGWGLVYPEAPFFEEFVIRCPRPVYKVNSLLRREGIVGGLDVSADGQSRMLLCVTETNTREEIDRLMYALEDMAAAE